jgi:hypothetical protein
MGLKQSRARSADRARQAADGSARAAFLPSNRAVLPIKDRLGEIWREIAEADEPSEIGPADTFEKSTGV